MSDLISTPTTKAESAFARLLRDWRQRRRLSQLDLALSSGVSQRHVSFLESGRANPSRAMILHLSETLDVPLRDRNDWLTAAGFAPIFRNRALDDPQMDQVMNAVRMMLRSHEPYPAVALDRAWNVRMSNAPFDLLGAMLGEDIWDRVGGGERNLMRLFFHPQGIRPFITNWSAVGPLMWRRAQREAEALAGAIEAIKISMFAVVATFGTAQDITADELRIETLFPADAETEALFRSAAF